MLYTSMPPNVTQGNFINHLLNISLAIGEKKACESSCGREVLIGQRSNINERKCPLLPKFITCISNIDRNNTGYLETPICSFPGLPYTSVLGISQSSKSNLAHKGTTLETLVRKILC